MYLKKLPDIKKRLQSSSIITLYSTDAIPPMKRPRCVLNRITLYDTFFYFTSIKATFSIRCLVCGVRWRPGTVVTNGTEKEQ